MPERHSSVPDEQPLRIEYSWSYHDFKVSTSARLWTIAFSISHNVILCIVRPVGREKTVRRKQERERVQKKLCVTGNTRGMTEYLRQSILEKAAGGPRRWGNSFAIVCWPLTKNDDMQRHTESGRSVRRTCVLRTILGERGSTYTLIHLCHTPAFPLEPETQKMTMQNSHH